MLADTTAAMPTTRQADKSTPPVPMMTKLMPIAMIRRVEDCWMMLINVLVAKNFGLMTAMTHDQTQQHQIDRLFGREAGDALQAEVCLLVFHHDGK